MTDENGNYIYCDCGKRCYSERDANYIINSAKKHRKSHTGKIPKRKYYCKICGYYHTTSQNKESFNADWGKFKGKKKYIKNTFYHK